ncbi:hypothetical protein M441DRAFT_391074 [Trichoderma asperellum CBS 433.97]|uniref:Uncharacterized protein n=1 Tax=Trichoderma asperellum (strain ATCC 204424 / CBS 433.97 / NBRC 101777) TaxID=1042311 RepID=A0A2T3ZCG1_TRIA4|nr:hypothetical protein M441DRAFT_391074 [Trichoderma asperellum CBS 433.97]PTB42493.1 hypothetical protein M441DRAFT_391074 [Trichoderma asperellum CBS 433.97]
MNVSFLKPNHMILLLAGILMAILLARSIMLRGWRISWSLVHSRSPKVFPLFYSCCTLWFVRHFLSAGLVRFGVA